MFVRKMQIDRALEFYGKGVGLRVLASSEAFIEFDAGSLPLRVVGVERWVKSAQRRYLQTELCDLTPGSPQRGRGHRRLHPGAPV